MQNLTIGKRIIVGFGVMLLLAALLAIVANWEIGKLSDNISELTHQAMPEMQIAGRIESSSLQAGYFMVAYSLNNDINWWNRAQPHVANVETAVQDLQRLIEQQGLSGLRNLHEQLSTNLANYKTAVIASREVGEALVAGRRQTIEAGNRFLSGIEQYVTMQNQAMARQIAEQDTFEELAVRRDRMVRSTGIRAGSQALFNRIWQAEAHIDMTALQALTPELQALRVEVAELLAIYKAGGKSRPAQRSQYGLSRGDRIR